MSELTIGEYKRSKATFADRLRWRLRHPVPIWIGFLFIMFCLCVGLQIAAVWGRG